MGGVNMQLVVYGAGGHGRVVADAAAAAGFDVLGFLDDRAPVNCAVLGQAVLGDASWLVDHSDVVVAHGIGDNAVRERVAQTIERIGCTIATVVHPSAIVSASALVGDGAVVLAQAVLNPGCTVGIGAIINTSAVVEHDCVVGDYAHVASRAGLAGGARLGRSALLGAGATVLPGRSVRSRGVVGAGAVVVHDVPADTVVVGVPARELR